jgi:hypothetical protein
MKGGKSGDLVRRLILALESQGARVLDATGTGAADKQRFLSALEAERSRTYATSAFDVLVGIPRSAAQRSFKRSSTAFWNDALFHQRRAEDDSC